MSMMFLLFIGIMCNIIFWDMPRKRDIKEEERYLVLREEATKIIEVDKGIMVNGYLFDNMKDAQEYSNELYKEMDKQFYEEMYRRGWRPK